MTRPLRSQMLSSLASAATAACLACVLGCGGETNDAALATENGEASPAVAAEPDGQAIDDGARLYAQHCAACHGEQGNGQGIAAQFLFPKPRDFRRGQFRIVSTVNGIPTGDDVKSVLERGMPGSTMPPWTHLGPEALEALTQQVLKFRQDGARDEFLQAMQEAGEEPDEETVAATVETVTTPGEVFAVPDLAAPTQEQLALGKQIYDTKGCAQCHGATGKGDGQQAMVDAEGLPTRPRDLTLGLFKGNPDAASVYRRIRLGMPGTPMPAAQNFPDEEIAAVVHYVLSLSDEAIRQSARFERRQIHARQVAQAPTSPLDQAWQAAEPVSIQTMPLWWRNDAKPGLQVQALHDGQSLALRLVWRDARSDQHALRSEAFEDAVAVELFSGEVEPFLGMGSKEAPVDLWFWDADRQSAAESLASYPRMVVDWYPLAEGAVETAEYQRPGAVGGPHPPVTLPAAAAGNAIVPYEQPAGSHLQVGGPGSITFRPQASQAVTAEAQWSDGSWQVVLSRRLALESPDEGIALESPQRVSVAFAVWDGAHRERDGIKQVSIWHDLLIESSQP